MSNISKDQVIAIQNTWGQGIVSIGAAFIEKQDFTAVAKKRIDTEGSEVKVEYTFGYILDPDQNLRINVHHSSIPYSG